MKSLTEFIAYYNNKGDIGNTLENKGQCVGLAFAWLLNLNHSHFYGHAKDLYNNAPDSEYTKIRNTSSAYPIAGDVIIWNSTAGGGYGHVAVVIGSSKEDDSVTVFEQNNPTNAPCRVYTYKNWKGIIGWLRPKNLSTGSTEALEAKIEELRLQREEYRKEIDELKENIEKCAAAKQDFATRFQIAEATLTEKEETWGKEKAEFETKIAEKLKQIAELEYEIDGVANKIVALTNEIEVLKAEKQAKLCDYSVGELIRALFSCR